MLGSVQFVRTSRLGASFVALFALLLSSVVGFAVPASAVQNTQVFVTVQLAGAPTALAGELVNVCYTKPMSGTLVCASATTGADGVAVVTLESIPDSVGSLTVSVGSVSSEYLLASQYLNIANGVVTANGSQVVDQSAPLQFSLEPRYALSGQVTVAGQPLPFFPMYLSYTAGSSYRCIDASTNAAGVYSIPSVPLSNVSLQQGICNNYTPPTYDSITSFNHIAGNASETHNIALTRTGIRVRVLEGSNPAASVSIKATRVGGQYPAEFSATSDAQGYAIFAGLTPGDTYRISYPSSMFQNGGGQKYDSKTNESTVTVPSTGSVAEETLVLTRTNGYPTTPVTISGAIVSGLNSTPVPNARVSAYAQSMSGGQGVSVNTIADSAGNYVLSELPYGTVNVSVTASGYKSTSANLTSSEAGGTAYTADFNVRSAAAGNLRYKGTLKERGTNTPIVNQTLYLNSLGGSEPLSVTTGPSGEFLFEGLAVGVYYLNASSWLDETYEPLPWTQSYLVLSQSELQAQLTLNRRSVGTATASGFVGSYLDSAGADSAVGMPETTVYLHPWSGGQGVQATTDNGGRWEVTGLLDGEKYWVSVMNADSSRWEYPNSEPVVARANGGSPHSLLFKEVTAGSGSLTGRVKDASTYSNLEGISVSLHRLQGGAAARVATTNERGEYSFDNLPAGEHYLYISDASGDYKSAFMLAEIGSGANRINALLNSVTNAPGTVSGIIKDERGIPMPGATVQIWDSKDSTIGGSAQTGPDGRYRITGIPVSKRLNFKVEPTWDLRYEVTSYLDTIQIPSSNPEFTKSIQLDNSALVTGRVGGIPSTGNVPTVFVQLINSGSMTVVATDWVDPESGQYTIPSVPQGSYYLLFTQNGKQESYTGGNEGFGSAGPMSELVSLEPLYWDGTSGGASDIDDATTISVSRGDRVSNTTINMTRGSSIKGLVTVDTPNGASKLTGTRFIQVNIYKKKLDGSYEAIGYPKSVDGFSNSQLEIAGLAQGTYKLKFEDLRQGANSLQTSYNGGASTLASAPEIYVGRQTTVTVNQTMSIAAPQRSAEAFDLDDLGSARLAELEGQIELDSILEPGQQTDVYVGLEFAGQYVSAVANSTPVTLGGWQQVDKNGYITVAMPASLSGEHRIAVQDAESQVIGWSEVQLVKESNSAKSTTGSSAQRRAAGASAVNSDAATQAPTVLPKQLDEWTDSSMENSVTEASTEEADTSFAGLISGLWLLLAGVGVAIVLVVITIWLVRRPRARVSS